MKKRFRKILFTIVSIVLVCVSVISVNAESYLMYEGFSFLYNSNGTSVIFSYDKRSNDVVIPHKLGSGYVSEIADYAFLNNSDMTSISFAQAKSLHKLGYSSFSGCSGLTDVVLPIWLTEISRSSFQSCTSLKNVTFYGNLYQIPIQAFYDCTSLDNVQLPLSVTTIGNFAFANCTSLSSIFIPRNTTEISDTAFKNSPNVTIKGYFGSYAEQYALEHNIPFEGVITHEMGDANLDKTVDIRDVTAIQYHIASIRLLSGEGLAVADYNGDGIINVLDITAIQKFIAGII